MFREALAAAIREARTPKPPAGLNWYTANIRWSLGASLWEAGDREAAITHLRPVYPLFAEGNRSTEEDKAEHRIVSRDVLRKLVHDLADYHEAKGEPGEASVWRETSPRTCPVAA